MEALENQQTYYKVSDILRKQMALTTPSKETARIQNGMRMNNPYKSSFLSLLTNPRKSETLDLFSIGSAELAKRQQLLQVRFNSAPALRVLVLRPKSARE